MVQQINVSTGMEQEKHAMDKIQSRAPEEPKSLSAKWFKEGLGFGLWEKYTVKKEEDGERKIETVNINGDR